MLSAPGPVDHGMDHGNARWWRRRKRPAPAVVASPLLRLAAAAGMLGAAVAAAAAGAVDMEIGGQGILREATQPPPFQPFHSIWEDERVVPILDEDDGDGGGKDQQQQAQAGVGGGGGGGAPVSSRAWRSRWRMESRYAELLVATSEFPFCAWDATTDASIYTPLLLDPNAVYQPQLLSFAAHPDRVYRIEARFPTTPIYFSFQSYTPRGLPLTSLADRHICPAWGCNPFRDGDCDSEAKAGGYQLHVTRTGDRGWPNEVRGLSEDITNSTWTPYTRLIDFLDNLSVLMLRFYVTKPPPSQWGGVDPPVITYSDDDGKTWKELKPCDDISRHLFNRAMKQAGWKVEAFSDVFHMSQWYRLHSCMLLGLREADHPNMLPNTALDTPGADNFVPYANRDSSYLHWCSDGRQLGRDFVMVVEGTAPLTATGLFEGPRRVSDVQSYQTRYWGFAAADVFIPGPTFSSLTANVMEEHYGLGWDRRYKVIAARSRDIAQACGLDDPGALFLPFANPNLNNDPPAIPALIEREMLARHTALGLEPEPNSIGYIVHRCQQERGCYNRTYIEGHLREQYPRLQVYKCDVKTGKAEPYVYKPYRRDYAGPKGDGGI